MRCLVKRNFSCSERLVPAISASHSPNALHRSYKTNFTKILKEDKKHFDRCTGSCVDNHVARCHQPNKNPKQHETGVALIPSHQRIAKSSARRIALQALLLLVTTTIVSFTKTLTLTFNSSKSIGKLLPDRMDADCAGSY
uniref:Uncharacterized protein n=1 Tax=Glossina palpalis gambiensis TaxID=67801 RepID=A0A1B0B1U1_9MUSC